MLGLRGAVEVWWLGWVCFGLLLVWFGLVLFGLVLFGLVLFGLVLFGLFLFCSCLWRGLVCSSAALG